MMAALLLRVSMTELVLLYSTRLSVPFQPVTSSLISMTSSCSDGAGGVQEDIAECIAKLSLLLHDALTAAGEHLPSPHYILLFSEPPLYTLSNPLCKALLAADLILPHDSGELLLFANQHRDKIAHALETVSLRCFSAYLLKLSKKDGPELGLYLLAVCRLPWNSVGVLLTYFS
ncbi:hypothetical protein BDW75DRAFT_92560 [Aspergillus navahoensis]